MTNYYYMNDERRRGYDAYGKCGHSRYDGEYDYRKGWEIKEDELRRERFREERRQEEDEANRQEELRMYREQQYKQQQEQEEVEGQWDTCQWDTCHDQEMLNYHQEDELRRGDLEK